MNTMNHVCILYAVYRYAAVRKDPRRQPVDPNFDG